MQEVQYYVKIGEFTSRCTACELNLIHDVMEWGNRAVGSKYARRWIVCSFCGWSERVKNIELEIDRRMNNDQLDDVDTSHLPKIAYGISGIYRRPYINSANTAKYWIFLMAVPILLVAVMGIEPSEKFAILMYVAPISGVFFYFLVYTISRKCARNRWMKELKGRYPGVKT